MNKPFILELQQELLAAGYDDVELRFVSDSGDNVTINLTFNGVVRRIGIFFQPDTNSATLYLDEVATMFTLQSAKDLACQIFERDPGTNILPDFRKFTGFNNDQH